MMGILLARKEIEELWREYEEANPGQDDWLWWDEFLIKAQLKKVVDYLKERADFMEWEWEDSKGIWDIVLDDIAWQALLKEAGLNKDVK